MSVPSRSPDRRMIRAVFALGVFAGGVMAAAALLRQLATH